MKIKIFVFPIFLNGQIYFVQTYKVFSLDNLRIFFQYKKNLILIEHNGQIIHPAIWFNTRIKSFDSIEILSIVGGG
jgi:thiamine biosynthesis protein ThiS